MSDETKCQDCGENEFDRRPNSGKPWRCCNCGRALTKDESWRLAYMTAGNKKLEAMSDETDSLEQPSPLTNVPSHATDGFGPCTTCGAAMHTYDSPGSYETIVATHEPGGVECLTRQLAYTQGAMRSDDERLRKACERVGVVMSCDAAEEMADKLLWVRKRVAAAQEILSLLPPSGRTVEYVKMLVADSGNYSDLIVTIEPASRGKETTEATALRLVALEAAVKDEGLVERAAGWKGACSEGGNRRCQLRSDGIVGYRHLLEAAAKPGVTTEQEDA